MQTANIATAKNQFSRLISQVKKGETIVITERNRPVARLQPLEPAAAPLSDLYRSGVLQPPAEAIWDVEAFLISLPQVPSLPAESSLAAALTLSAAHGQPLPFLCADQRLLAAAEIEGLACL